MEENVMGFLAEYVPDFRELEDVPALDPELVPRFRRVHDRVWVAPNFSVGLAKLDNRYMVLAPDIRFDTSSASVRYNIYLPRDWDGVGYGWFKLYSIIEPGGDSVIARVEAEITYRGNIGKRSDEIVITVVDGKPYAIAKHHAIGSKHRSIILAAPIGGDKLVSVRVPMGRGLTIDNAMLVARYIHARTTRDIVKLSSNNANDTPEIKPYLAVLMPVDDSNEQAAYEVWTPWSRIPVNQVAAALLADLAASGGLVYVEELNEDVGCCALRIGLYDLTTLKTVALMNGMRWLLDALTYNVDMIHSRMISHIING